MRWMEDSTMDVAIDKAASSAVDTTVLMKMAHVTSFRMSGRSLTPDLMLRITHLKISQSLLSLTSR